MKQQPEKGQVIAPQPTTEDEIPKVIYADRIINAGFGAGVSRLSLAMETGSGIYKTSAILVLPTPALLEAMTQVLNALHGNAEVRQGLIKALDDFKEQLNTLS